MKFILLCLVIGSAAAMPLFHNESTICEDGNGLCEKAAMKYERIADIQVRVGSRDAPSSGAVRAAGPCVNDGMRCAAQLRVRCVLHTSSPRPPRSHTTALLPPPARLVRSRPIRRPNGPRTPPPLP